jgi:hypothetical protein
VSAVQQKSTCKHVIANQVRPHGVRVLPRQWWLQPELLMFQIKTECVATTVEELQQKTGIVRAVLPPLFFEDF